MKFSYILPYYDNERRKENLFYILEWLHQNEHKAEFEVIVVEQGNHRTLSPDLLKADKYIFIHSNTAFNKSLCNNRAIQLAQYERLVFADNDILINFDELIYAINQPFQVVSPKKNLYDLKQNEIPPTNGFPRIVPFAGGIFIIDKIALKSIGNWNEGFVGWGYEDNELTSRIQAFLSYTTINNKAYHLWHPKAIKDRILHRNNIKLFTTEESKIKMEIRKRKLLQK